MPTEEEQARMLNFHQQSTIPMVNFENHGKASSDTSDEDEDSGMEFDSDDS